MSENFMAAHFVVCGETLLTVYQSAALWLLRLLLKIF